MRGRAISISVVLLLISSAAFPACNWTPRHSAAFRSTVYDVLLDADGYVVTANGYGVQLYNPAGTLVGTLALPGQTRVVERAGATIYAGSGSRIYILRRAGNTLQVVRFVEAGGTVNDIVATSYLYAATSNGIAQFHLIDVADPIRTGATISTSRPNVMSLAYDQITQRLYAADGDATVEIFTLAVPAFPQQTGTIESLPRSASVYQDRGLVFVSDEFGQNAEVFSGGSGTRVARLPFAANALMPLTGNLYLIAGDRTVRAIDITSTARVAELFEQQLAPTGGTNNHVYSFTRTGDTVYAAAGDMGLVKFNVHALVTAPHPLVSYADGATTSALLIGTDAFFTDNAGTVAQMSVNRGGIALIPTRTWSAGASSILRDHATTTLLTSNGATAKIWTIATQTAAQTITFRGAVRSAVLTANDSVVALLTDGSVWRTNGATPQQADLGGATMAQLARAGNALALAQVSGDGQTTQLRYYATGDLAAAPRTFTINGAVTGGLALNASSAALFTFSGLNVVDLVSGAVRVLPESNRIIPRQLQFSNNDLLVLGDRTLEVWNSVTGAKLREHALPANAAAMHAAGEVALVATSEGTIALEHGTAVPVATAAMTNRYYTTAVAAGERLYLFDESRVDLFATGGGAAPHYLTSIDASGAIDLAALPHAFFTLAGNGAITAYSKAGGVIAQTAIDEGADAQPESIATAGNAVWVSISKGCASGNCQEKTLVLDPASLAITATLDGGAHDVFVSGTRAYALFTTPDEIRIFNIANAAQPAQLASAPSPAQAQSIAFASNRVYVLANRIHAFDQSLLAAGEFLSPASASGAELHVEGDCAVIAGRGANAELYTTPAWTAAALPAEAPSTLRTIAAVAGQMFLLTDHSLEVWSTSAPPPPPRRRAAR